MRLILFLICGCCIMACTAKQASKGEHISTVAWDTVQTAYADNFTIQKKGAYTLLSIGAAWKNAEPSFQYLLYPKGSTAPADFPEATRIAIPAERILCSGTVDVAFLQALKAEKRIVGISNGAYLYDKVIRNRLEEGQIADIGQSQGINYEKAITTNPDLAFVYSIGDQQTYKKFPNLGIPAVMLSDFMEKTPLGRAEWLLFVSCFVGKEAEAMAYFEGVKTSYEKIKRQAANYSYSPSVLTGAVYRGTWYIAGGKSLMATLINDAGGNYLWKDNGEVGGVPLDFEAVYGKAVDADIWINQSTYSERAALLAAEPRYQDFKAVHENKIYNYYKRANEQGGTDIFESAIVRPDRVLKDMVHLFNARPVQSDSLYYYARLTSN